MQRNFLGKIRSCMKTELRHKHEDNILVLLVYMWKTIIKLSYLDHLIFVLLCIDWNRGPHWGRQIITDKLFTPSHWVWRCDKHRRGQYSKSWPAQTPPSNFNHSSRPCAFQRYIQRESRPLQWTSWWGTVECSGRGETHTL